MEPNPAIRHAPYRARPAPRTPASPLGAGFGGTPAYKSPEQADGKPADARSDLYSVGCVLYEVLTGRPPFTGDSPAVVLFQHLHKAPQPLSQLNPALALFWEQVLATALAKDPRQRH
ncbi:protein kinase domain-containing protein [Streptosporangium pseudovulgare]|uniref:non-specific serine/threonine protein kinase n=1 Tax=Streptosporangium pseudovulgare TaxID=35765 RepID=A0ABQ2RJ39_9ACTN|nr:hypothetical protein [Streptosporangium pseudovulgare]GGQ34889.1 hypothetical protein GCM10010140_76250 [Streptosporangium pseudovulgare]